MSGDELKVGVVTIGDFQNLPSGFSPDEPLFVLTDIHACTKTMELLLAHKPAEARFVFLGDAIDRGPDPIGTLKLVLKDPNTIILRGNHDGMGWFSQEGVKPTFENMFSYWRNNGGTTTRRLFREAIDENNEPVAKVGGITPLVFEQYWERGKNWWLSGNILFVHGGYPKDRDKAWLDMDPIKAASNEDSPYWWRFYEKSKLYKEPSLLDGKPVFVINGHTPLKAKYTLRPYGINLDRGYQEKLAAEIWPAENGAPAKVRFLSTDCDEIYAGKKMEIPDIFSYYDEDE